MKVIVTGGAGYIGSHTIIEIFENTDWEVISIDSFINSSKESYERIQKITGKDVQNFQIDITNLELLQSTIDSLGKIDGIIHFAALKAVGESVEKPLLYYHNNLTGLMNILACCRAFNIPSFVFSSSCSIYGNVTDLPVDENTPLSKAESPYAETKAMGEQILQDFAKVHNVNTISLRYFNPVGAHLSGIIGENPINKPNNLFPVITQNAVGKIEVMEVFGTDYNTRDGSCIRDYIHVSDIATAHIEALKYANRVELNDVEFFNLGSGKGVSVLEAISTFEKISLKKLNYHLADRRPGDVEAIFSNSQKAKKTLNWIPKFNLEEMMKSAWKWQLQLEKENNE